MQKIIQIESSEREELIDITQHVKEFLKESKIQSGILNIYAQGATAAIMIQENWDASIRTDVVNFLRKIIPEGAWIHDQEDGNGDAHLKSGLVGPSESVPIIDGELGLSQWQNIFFCEFDGPRTERNFVLTTLQ